MIHKYRAVQTTIDNIKFPSKKEARRYQDLLLLKKSGEVVFFLRQTPFHMPGNIKYLIDFMVFWKNGDITFEDVKGFDTPVSKLKRKVVEDLYPVKIELI